MSILHAHQCLLYARECLAWAYYIRENQAIYREDPNPAENILIFSSSPPLLQENCDEVADLNNFPKTDKDRKDEECQHHYWRDVRYSHPRIT